MVQAEAGVVPVSGQDDGEEKEAAAGGEEQPDGWTDDGCAEEVDVVEVPAEQETEEEPCAEVEEEGCAEESRPEENEAGEEWEGQEWEEEAPAAAEEPCAAEACAEEPAPAIEVVETPVEQPEETKPRTFAEVLESQGEAGTDGCAVAIESEDEVPAAAEEVAEEAPAVEEPAAEPCGEEQAEEWVEETPDMEPCGEEQAESGVDVGVVEMTEEDAATTEVADFESDDPRVVMVAGSMVRLPRMPFFGCEDVSYEDFRAVVEEILRSPE